jgi:hypothetical protein
MHLRQPGFGHAKEKGPSRCRQQRRDPDGDWGASVSGRQRRLERRLPRRLWRSRWARRFPMAEPACWAISNRKARSGSQRISKRHPASSHHKDRVHTLAPRPIRGLGFNGGTGATKKRPACARRSAPVALFGHTPTTTCRSVTLGQVVGQVRWSTVVDLPVVAAASGQSGHRRSPAGQPAPVGRLDLCLQVVEALGAGHSHSHAASTRARRMVRTAARPGRAGRPIAYEPGSLSIVPPPRPCPPIISTASSA